MIDWSTVIPALKQWVCLGTGLKQCVQENEKRPYVSAAYARMQVVSDNAVGTDETKTIVESVIVDGESVQRLTKVIQGQRTFTLRLFVETNSQSGAGMADNALERLRAVRDLPTMRAMLDTVNVCVASFGDSQMADVTIDERTFSAWFVDIEMNAGFAFYERDDVDGVIESVGIYATVPTDSDIFQEIVVP